MESGKIAYLYVGLTVVLWGSAAAVAKLMLQSLNSFQVLFFTSLIATLSLFIVASFQKKLSIIKKYRANDYLHFAYMGFVGVFLYYILLYTGLTLAPAQEAFIVNYTWPIWVVVFAIIFLKETITKEKIISILLGAAGVFIVASKGHLSIFSVEHLRGDLFALAGAVSYGIFSVLGKKYNYDKITSMMFYYIFTFIFISISIGIFSEIPMVTIKEILGLTWIGVFSGGLGSLFWFLALQRGDTAEMSTIIFLTPFMSLVFIWAFVGESILPSSVVGLLLIICGVMVKPFFNIMSKKYPN
jgi:drug/metabolite transporter (DMT)-like permease